MHSVSHVGYTIGRLGMSSLVSWTKRLAPEQKIHGRSRWPSGHIRQNRVETYYCPTVLLSEH
eukprot:2443172-Pleurochrysis_carterae.AAC.1